MSENDNNKSDLNSLINSIKTIDFKDITHEIASLKDLPELGPKEYFKEHKIITAFLALILCCVILGICAIGYAKGFGSASGDAAGSGDASGDYVYEEFEVDAYEEINTLMTSYYTAYADGDMDTLTRLASPLSDFEQSYIQVMSEYVESYNDITVYTKSGLDEDSYIVSVSMMMKFVDVETEAPGIETFYIQKNEDGEWYINNLYSWFNYSSGTLEADEAIVNRISAYESETNVVELFSQIETSYNVALENDEALATMVQVTVPEAISKWAAEYTQEDTQTAGEETASDEEASSEEEETEQADADETESDDESETGTVYR